jgi:predicted CoA-substrate-specific enzyme activase
MIACGCDVGSLTGKAVILAEGRIISHSIVPVMVRPEQTAQCALDAALASTPLDRDDIGRLVGTGYGRARIPTADDNVSEITCHARGAHWLDPSVRTIIDIGGQDCKVIVLDDDGNVEDFLMNDKCAAGTGRFLEGVARALELDLDQMGPLSLESGSPAPISSQCSVFAESEVVTLLSEGVSVQDIVAGVHRAIASRLVSMVRRIGLKPRLTLAGGVAKNAGVVGFLEESLGGTARPAADPQIVGALGAALIASDRKPGGTTT